MMKQTIAPISRMTLLLMLVVASSAAEHSDTLRLTLPESNLLHKVSPASSTVLTKRALEATPTEGTANEPQNWWNIFDIFRAPNATEVCSVLQLESDTCEYRMDNECDAGRWCETGTDCFDCDPCQEHAADCETCVAAGCLFATTSTGTTDASSVCSSPEIATFYEGGTAYFSTCDNVTASNSSDMDDTTGYTCDAADETCVFNNDGKCDANGFFSSCWRPQSDCFDCDPCQAYRFQGCEACTTAPEGCVWCGTDAICKSVGTTVPVDKMMCTESDFVSTCSLSATAFYADPLYDSMVWLYDLVRIQPVWEAGYTGAGIGIRINDDGVDAAHPEFSSKFDASSSCTDFLPYVVDSKHNHGTACAALATGSANDACSVGMAPNATLSACRIISYAGEATTPEASDSSYLFANMENMHVSSNSYGIHSCTLELSRRSLQEQTCPFSTLSPTSPCLLDECSEVDWSNPVPQASCETAIAIYCYSEFQNDVQACTESLDFFVQCQFGGQTVQEQEAFTKGATEGRDGKGIIYVFAAHNFYGLGDYVNFAGTLNSRFVIAVGSVGKDGVHASYSNVGATLFVSAPGGDFENYSNNLVAVAGGGCTEGSSGTSQATPVVSGIVALMLEANDELTWRDVQGILAFTSQLVQPDDPSWTTNAAGFHHSYSYGFGLIDASAAVNAARTWANFNDETELVGESGTVDISIPEFPSEAVESKVNVTAPSTFVMESVSVYLDLVHSSRGHLEIALVSPQGTNSILVPGERPENAQQMERWKLTTVRNWGESANGEWTLRLLDRREGDFSTCVDVANWSISVVYENVTEPFEWQCGLIRQLDICTSDGTEGLGFPIQFEGEGIASSIDDPIFTDTNNVSVVDACCACGGGQAASAVVDMLKSWSMAIYGHNGTSAPASGLGKPEVVVTGTVPTPTITVYVVV